MQPSITIPGNAQSITIGTDGTVASTLAGQTAPTQLGTLQLADFINPAGLQPHGENLLVETAASGTAQRGTPGLKGIGTLAQGSLESSNVNVVEELVSMIETQRAYEMNSKAIWAPHTTARRLFALHRSWQCRAGRPGRFHTVRSVCSPAPPVPRCR